MIEMMNIIESEISWNAFYASERATKQKGG